MDLKLLSANIRLDIIKMLKHRGYGHVGGSLSIVELLSVLYGKQMQYDPKNPTWENRDRLVLSKGHAGPALYSALANVGFFDKSELYTLNDGGTNLPSHPDKIKVTGVDMTTGSLGQGTSAAAGIALALEKKHSDNYVYLIVGDGELNEGQCWEAFQFIAGKRLSNCIVIIDENGKQLDGETEDILYPFDIQAKMQAFGFHTIKVDGSDMEAIDDGINHLKEVKDQAICMVLKTIKGQGVPYFENLAANHSVKFNNDEINQATDEAIKTLEEEIKQRG